MLALGKAHRDNQVASTQDDDGSTTDRFELKILVAARVVWSLPVAAGLPGVYGRSDTTCTRQRFFLRAQRRHDTLGIYKDGGSESVALLSCMMLRCWIQVLGTCFKYVRCPVFILLPIPFRTHFDDNEVLRFTRGQQGCPNH